MSVFTTKRHGPAVSFSGSTDRWQSLLAAFSSTNTITWVFTVRLAIFALAVHGLPRAQSMLFLVLNGLLCAEGLLALVLKLQRK